MLGGIPPSISVLWMLAAHGPAGQPRISSRSVLVLPFEGHYFCSLSLYNVRNNEKLWVRVIHCAHLKLSTIQVFYGDDMTVISHLIGADQLPGQQQVCHGVR